MSFRDPSEELKRKDSNDRFTDGCRPRRQELQQTDHGETPSVDKESTRQHGRKKQQLDDFGVIYSSVTERTMDDKIPSIMNTFSFRGTSSKGVIRRKRSVDTNSIYHGQQQRQMESVESTAMDKYVGSDRQGRHECEQQLERVEKGYSSSIEEAMEEAIPSIINALSHNDIKDDMIRKRDTEPRAAHSQQQRQIDASTGIPLARKRGRGHRNQQQQPNGGAEMRTKVTEEDVDFIDVLPAIIDVCSMNIDEEKKTYPAKTSEVRKDEELLFSTKTSGSNNGFRGIFENGDGGDGSHVRFSSSINKEFSINDESSKRESVQNLRSNGSLNAQIFPSIRNVLSMDDYRSSITENVGMVGNGIGRVYPFMRNVFSLNDIGDDVSQNPEEILPVSSPRRYEEKGNRQQQKNKPTQKIIVTRAYEVKEHYLESLFYVSISAILGSVFRVYMARIFGLDCQYKASDDFLIPLTSNICVTNDGRTVQTGGALFIDFPSNVFGRSVPR